MDHTLAAEDRRKYVRLKNICPVEFTIVRLQGNLPGVDWQRGYTKDVSEGGLSLESVQLSESTIKYLQSQSIFLELRIHIPLSTTCVKAVGDVAWFHKDNEIHNKYTLGVKFRSIAQADLKRILSMARYYRNFFREAIILSIILAMALILILIFQFSF